jgi:CheY-like chemotaxis protein
VPKLLLADDSPTTQKVVQLTFADEGVEVIIADDGDAAIELYDHHHPDIVLADINIPGLNGYEVCESIRKRSSNGPTPVILLAGSFEPFDVEQARRVGANDYLTKPFSSIRRLVATVTALLDTVTRADHTADETIEPNSTPPNPSEPASFQHNSVEPHAGPPLPVEPDMLSTNDIENLYHQSVVETGEAAPGHITPRDVDDSYSKSDDGNKTSLDDVAFDDELIEATFTGSEAVEPDSAVHGQDGPFTEVETASAGEPTLQQYENGPSEPTMEIPVPEENLPETELEIPQSQIPTVSFESPEYVSQTKSFEMQLPANGNEFDRNEPAVQPKEEFQIDQSADEAYFEPESESHGSPLGPDALAESADGIAESAGAASISNLEAMPESFALPEIEQKEADQNEPAPDTGEKWSEGVYESAAQTETESGGQNWAPSPWESIAGQTSSTFSLDELNLLELPYASVPSPRAEQPKSSEPDVTEKVNQMTPEIVDQIAKATALQISEELVREIAQRIIPKVIEEVIARQNDDNTDH